MATSAATSAAPDRSGALTASRPNATAPATVRAVRRFVVILACVGTALLGACRGSSSDDSDTGSATTAASAGSATTVQAGSSNAAFAEVCARRASATPPAQGQAANFADAAKDLQYAVDHAPADLKPDMTILAGPLVQYFQILASANGNFTAAASNPQFVALAHRFSQTDFQAAAQRVQAWFASHCS